MTGAVNLLYMLSICAWNRGEVIILGLGVVLCILERFRSACKPLKLVRNSFSYTYLYP